MEDDVRTIKKYVETGDTAYLGHLYEKYWKPIYLYCWKFLQDRQDAEDATQEVFVKMCLHIRTWRPTGKFTSWLLTIARTTCVDISRRKKQKVVEDIKKLEDVLIVDDPSPEHPDENAIKNAEEERLKKAKEERQGIVKIVLGLEIEQKRCFCLFHFHNKSYKEIAQRTGYTLDQVRSYLQNARRNFKNRWIELTKE